MADVSDYAKRVERFRTQLTTSFDDNPRVAAVAAFDAVTELLIGVIDELREQRIRGR